MSSPSTLVPSHKPRRAARRPDEAPQTFLDTQTLADTGEGFPLPVTADFAPTTIAEIADQHRRFLATLPEPAVEVELLDDPA